MSAGIRAPAAAVRQRTRPAYVKLGSVHNATEGTGLGAGGISVLISVNRWFQGRGLIGEKGQMTSVWASYQSNQFLPVCLRPF